MFHVNPIHFFSLSLYKSGTKHIDPDTGLIYFKYDFGYEFGIIFPGEGKKIIGGYRDDRSGGFQRNEVSARPSIRQAGDIEVPVLHESSLEPVNKRYSLPPKFAGGEMPHYAPADPKQSGTQNVCYSVA